MNSIVKNTSDLNSNMTNLFKSIDSKDDLAYEKRMVTFRILSEIERVAEEKRITRKEIARLIGTSASYITQLLRGYKIINIETLAKIQKALDITFEFKAIPNKTELNVHNLNLSQICENQTPIEGFWAFYKFKRDYNHEETPFVNKENGLRRTA